MLFIWAFPLLASTAVFGVTLAFWTARALGRRWDARLSHGTGRVDAPPAEKKEEQADRASLGQRSMEKGIENLMTYDLEVYKARQGGQEGTSWQ